MVIPLRDDGHLLELLSPPDFPEEQEILDKSQIHELKEGVTEIGKPVSEPIRIMVGRRRLIPRIAKPVLGTFVVINVTGLPPDHVANAAFSEEIVSTARKQEGAWFDFRQLRNVLAAHEHVGQPVASGSTGVDTKFGATHQIECVVSFTAYTPKLKWRKRIGSLGN